MAINYDLIKFYQCAHWINDNSHGGGISGVEIFTKKDENIFEKVTDFSRRIGAIDYKKVFIKNENAEIWQDVVGWLISDTIAPNDNISISGAGTESRLGIPAPLSGISKIEGEFVIGDTSTNFLKEVGIGEKVYNGTNDTNSSAIEIISIQHKVLTLASEYMGSVGVDKKIYVTPAKDFLFKAPLTNDDDKRLCYGDIAINDYVGIWLKRTVLAAGAYYASNSFTVGMISKNLL